MSRKNKKDDNELSAEVLPPVEAEPKITINQNNIKVLAKIEGMTPEKMKELLDADLKRVERLLELRRKDALEHPDAIEAREISKFRRQQYNFLLLILFIIIVITPFINLSAAAFFGSLALLIVAGVLLNGREREIDAKTILSIIKEIMRRKR